MRQKDANLVAKIIGNEMRLAANIEKHGLETALGAVKAQMEGNDRNFNGDEYDRNFNEGLTVGWGTPAPAILPSRGGTDREMLEEFIAERKVLIEGGSYMAQRELLDAQEALRDLDRAESAAVQDERKLAPSWADPSLEISDRFDPR